VWVDESKEAFMSAAETHREKLVEEFGAVLTEAEGMLKAAAAETAIRRDLRSQVEAAALAKPGCRI
jgi:hypothetical protein